MRALAVGLGLAAIACTGSAKPHSRAQRIGALDEAIGGPHAIGQIGDYLLENDQVRFVISDTGRSNDPTKLQTLGRVNTIYGGSLVDADLVRAGGAGGHGNDQLAELLPGFVFTVIDPSDVCVPSKQTERCPTLPGEELLDGSDGGDAAVLVTGKGGDLLQMVAALNTGLMFPGNLELRVLYRLKPGAKHVDIECTIKNTTTGAHPFPFLQPSEFGDLGKEVPGFDQLQLSVPMGMLPLFGGEQDLFTPGAAGFNVEFAINDTYTMPGGFPAFPGHGRRLRRVARQGRVVRPDDAESRRQLRQHVQDAAERQARLSRAGRERLLGAAAVHVRRRRRRVHVRAAAGAGGGRGVHVHGAVRRRARGCRVGRRRDPRAARRADRHVRRPRRRRADERAGRARKRVRARRQGPPDQPDRDRRHRRVRGAAGARQVLGGGRHERPRAQRQARDRHPCRRADRRVRADAAAGDARRPGIRRARPPRAGEDPADRHVRGAGGTARDPRALGLYDLRLGEKHRPTAFDGTNRYVEGAWWTKDGELDAQVRPGTYELVVSRGPEYEVTTKQITIKAGEFATEQVSLVRAYDTPGWVAGDFHLHAAPSTDSGLPIDQRVISCAAEGLEVAVATDHNYITDYAPVIAASGLDPWLLGIPGVELTTFEMGHFNAYPLRIDPGSTRGGEYQWAQEPPQVLFDTLRKLGTDPTNTIVQVNHPRQQVLGYWAQFFVDAQTAEPYTPSGILGVFTPFGTEFLPENYSTDFDAVELLTGRRTEDIHSFRAPNPLPPGVDPNPPLVVPGEIVLQQDADGTRPKFPGVVETWFTMLDRGHTATGMGTSDTHKLLGHEPGYARTMLFVGAGKDVPGGTSRDDVVRAIHAHHAITTNAPFIEMTTDGGAFIGDTVKGGSHSFHIHVAAPSWAQADTLVVYSNSAVIKTMPIGNTPGKPTAFDTDISVSVAADAWVVAEVTGSSNMFPVLSPTEFPPLDATVVIQSIAAGIGDGLSTLPLVSKLKPERLHTSTPYAITNPIWIDVAGNGFDPPKAPLKRRASSTPRPLPDVRRQFDALPEVSP